jgi:Holliday junction resolvase RusA-like endonuclease
MSVVELFTDRAGELVFYVPGRAQTAGSKSSGVAHRFNAQTGRHEPVRRPDGRLVTFTNESGDRKAKDAWRTDVRAAAVAAMPPRFELWGKQDALEVELVFVRPRPATHLRTGRHAGQLKPWAVDARPVTVPDLLKVARAVEDALKGVAYADDSSIVSERLAKVYGDQVGLTVSSEGLGVRIAPATGEVSLPAGTVRDVPDPKGA